MALKRLRRFIRKPVRTAVKPLTKLIKGSRDREKLNTENIDNAEAATRAANTEGVDASRGSIGRFQETGRGLTTTGMANEGASRQSQTGAVGLLQDAAMGNAPSAAEVMAKQGGDRAAQLATSVAASGRGSAASSSRAAINAGTSAVQQANTEASRLRADEMANARGQLAQATTAQRAQDQATLGQGLQTEATGTQMQTALETGERDRILQTAGANSAAMGAQKDRVLGFTGGVLESVSNLAAKSDRRAKEDVRSADSELEALLEKGEGASYKYKEGVGEPRDRRVSPMAQEVEDVAPEAVSEGEDGYKVIDYGRLGMSPVSLSALALLHKRLKKLEGEK